jgi:hypothetical protein
LGGWLALGRGQAVEACARLDVAAETGARPGMGMMEPLGLLCSARARATAGQPELGLPAARRALAIAEREMPFHHAEALIVEAELLRMTGVERAEVAGRLTRAVEVAGRQGARLQELRALTRLARGDRGRCDPSTDTWARALEERCSCLPAEDRASVLAGPVGGD